MLLSNSCVRPQRIDGRIGLLCTPGSVQIQHIGSDNEVGPTVMDLVMSDVRAYSLYVNPLFTTMSCSGSVILTSVLINGQLLEAVNLNEQIDVDEDYFSALFCQAHEMAQFIDKGQRPSNAKVHDLLFIRPSSMDALISST